MPYTHLTPFHCGHIEILREAGVSIRRIAAKLGRRPSTISRELRRNSSLKGRYKAKSAQRTYHELHRTGDWEADLVLGRQSGSAILTLDEVKHGYLLTQKVPDRRAYTVGRAIRDAFRAIHHTLVKTITFDNGKEFAYFKKIEKNPDALTYFSDPYAAWQRGTNENTNGLIRKYIPKKTNLRQLDQTHLNAIADELNNRA